jgi:two-component system C4-dicarboxylate transport sensor histidine kinase DctB
MLLAALAAAAAFWVALNIGRDTLNSTLDQSLILTARAVETEIERFRPLPAVAAEDARIRAAIRIPGDAQAIATANDYLARITAHSGAAQLFLLNKDGTAIAASNHNTAQSLIGQNYGFRPYFRDALTTGKGRFYAIGVTTGLPGYFLSTRIDYDGDIGVLVVKVDLTPLQATWASAGLATAIADGDGVVFLSGVADWLYRPMTSLDAQTLSRIRDTRTYEGVDLTAASPLEFGTDSTLQMRVRALETEGWRLLAAAPAGPPKTAAALSALGAALLALLATGLAKIAHQRRQLVHLRLRQNTLLEARVEERTRDLAREVQARRQTEEELRATQQGLIHSEKMAALGRMSAAIVHEISQPLAAMEATLAATELSLPASEAATHTRVATARNLIRRMQRTTKHLKSFSRKEQGDLALIDLATVIENACDLTAPRAKTAGISPQILPSPPLMVRAGAVRMEQVCVNLLLNALDAVEGRADASITIAALATPQGHAIVVTDTGPGIQPEDLPRVTEPFFSTKISGEGLGLGLSISQAIVTEFGGRIDIRSAPGAGTTVTVTLPAAAAQQAAQ